MTMTRPRNKGSDAITRPPATISPQAAIGAGLAITARIDDSGEELTLTHDFSEHEREILVAGGLLSFLREGGGNGTADSGGGRGEQRDAGERAETGDGRGGGGDGVIREPAQGVGGHHE